LVFLFFDLYHLCENWNPERMFPNNLVMVHMPVVN
jgi:hypothetical protein